MKIRLIGNKAKRLRNKSELAHKPLPWGKGRWHSRTVLWKARGHARRRRAIASASRRRNRLVAGRWGRPASRALRLLIRRGIEAMVMESPLAQQLFDTAVLLARVH
jgi:hypothetical protein